MAVLIVIAPLPRLAAQSAGVNLELKAGPSRAYRAGGAALAASVTMPVLRAHGLTGRLMLDANYLSSDLASLPISDQRHLVGASLGLRVETLPAAMVSPFGEVFGGIAHVRNTDHPTLVDGASPVAPITPEDYPSRGGTGAVFGAGIGMHLRTSRTIALMAEGRMEHHDIYDAASRGSALRMLVGVSFGVR